MRHFFVSYTHKDFAKALDIARVLKDSSGADYWIDESGIKSWYRFIEVIVRALDDSFALVVIMSRSVLQSKYVKLEIGYALKKGIQVIPVSVDGQPVHSRVRPFSDLRECVGARKDGVTGACKFIANTWIFRIFARSSLLKITFKNYDYEVRMFCLRLRV